MYEDVTLVDLISPSILQKMQNSFAQMARMAAITTNENGVPVTKGTNFTRMCSEMCRTSEKGRKRCENCDRNGANITLEKQKPVSYECHAHLVDFAAPIMLGDRMIGSFVGGQVLAEPIEPDKMREVAREIEVDEEEFVKAASEIQIIPQAAIDRSTQFIYEFAQVISDMAYSAYLSQQLSKEAMQAAIQKSDFLANMSHEIRTPMNAVLGMAEMAEREEMSDEARAYIHQIQSSGKHLLTIINDILDFSKIDSGKMEIVETPYNVSEMLADISNLVNSRIGTKDLTFIVDVPYDIPVELIGDNIRIHQILINLLTNAVKFTQRGKIELKVSFERTGEDEALFTMAVSDTGNGIKPEDLEKLFQSFQQVDSKRNRSIEGTGLGLAITKQLLDLMHGEISVDSEYGKGSTFTTKIPQKIFKERKAFSCEQKDLHVYMLVENEYIKEQLTRELSEVDIPVIDLAEDNMKNIPGNVAFVIERKLLTDEMLGKIEKYPGLRVVLIDNYDGDNSLKHSNIHVLRRPVTIQKFYAALGIIQDDSYEVTEEDVFAFEAPEAEILIVDDNAINLTVAKGLLEPLNMKVDVAESANACIEKLRGKTYDIIFMDHMMPDVDGIEATHIIRRLVPGYAEVPIIALTANAVGGAKEMFIKEGMNDFVAKPIETKKIVAIIKKWLPVEKIVPVDKDKKPKTTEEGKKASGETSWASDILVREGFNVKSALELLGSEALYMKILREYYLGIDKKASVIRTHYENKDYQNYTIEVHSLKSTSKQIGADNLSGFAARLEQAGDSRDISFIENNTEELLKDLLKVKDSLGRVFPDELQKTESVKADRNSTMKLLDELIEALNEMDTLIIDEVVEKIQNYEYDDGDECQFLQILTGSVEEYDIDECIKIVDEWKAYLQE